MPHPRQYPHLYRSQQQLKALFLSAPLRKAAALARRALHHKARVLDICCGMGAFCAALHHQHLKVTGLEKDPWVLQEAGQHLPPTVELLLAGEHFLPPGSFAMATLCLGLHSREREQALALIAEMRRLAPLALVMDWQMAEHHLALPLVALVRWQERLGKVHYAAYEQYMKNGGLEGMLYSLRNEGRVLARASWLGGTLGCALIEWD